MKKTFKSQSRTLQYAYSLYFKQLIHVAFKFINNSSGLTDKIITVTVFGYQILISIHVYYYISTFSPLALVSMEKILSLLTVLIII